MPDVVLGGPASPCGPLGPGGPGSPIGPFELWLQIISAPATAMIVSIPTTDMALIGDTARTAGATSSPLGVTAWTARGKSSPLDITRPHILDGNDPSAPTIYASGEITPHGESARRSLARERSETTIDVRRWEVRARNSAPCDAVRSNSAVASSRKRPKTVGRGNDGASAGTNAPARWMSVQIGQWSSAGCSRPAGLDGALSSSGAGGAPASTLAPAATGAMRSRCTCPN